MDITLFAVRVQDPTVCLDTWYTWDNQKQELRAKTWQKCSSGCVGAKTVEKITPLAAFSQKLEGFIDDFVCDPGMFLYIVPQGHPIFGRIGVLCTKKMKKVGNYFFKKVARRSHFCGSCAVLFGTQPCFEYHVSKRTVYKSCILILYYNNIIILILFFILAIHNTVIVAEYRIISQKIIICCQWTKVQCWNIYNLQAILKSRCFILHDIQV